MQCFHGNGLLSVGIKDNIRCSMKKSMASYVLFLILREVTQNTLLSIEVKCSNMYAVCLPKEACLCLFLLGSWSHKNSHRYQNSKFPEEKHDLVSQPGKAILSLREYFKSHILRHQPRINPINRLMKKQLQFQTVNFKSL